MGKGKLVRFGVRIRCPYWGRNQGRAALYAQTDTRKLCQWRLFTSDPRRVMHAPRAATAADATSPSTTRPWIKYDCVKKTNSANFKRRRRYCSNVKMTLPEGTLHRPLFILT
ncbi:hypothetical protein EVAR_50400_1 [Eumeta japonica]|uniref:Uncharacterized protein n=1 Tax=Eumeta variegata TaxID=151549 RepID=A0A4C1WTV3_EUMVA|nr:hypothetical protein EVAR_50400_1 [Eumeta japonica]